MTMPRAFPSSPMAMFLVTEAMWSWSPVSRTPRVGAAQSRASLHCQEIVIETAGKEPLKHYYCRSSKQFNDQIFGLDIDNVLMALTLVENHVAARGKWITWSPEVT